MGSSFSVANWMAAAAGGVAPDTPGVTQAAMQAVGIDGRSMAMSTAAFNLEAWHRVPSQLNCQSFRT